MSMEFTPTSPSSDVDGLLATDVALAQIGGVLDSINHAARARLDAETRVGLVQTVAALGRRLEALKVVLVGEAERHQAAQTARGVSLRSVLATTGQITPSEAAFWGYAAKSLAGHDRVQAAALAGAVSIQQARAIDTVLTELPPSLNKEQRARAEQVLLGKAETLDAKTLSTQGRAVLEEVAPEIDAVTDELERLDAQRRRAHANRAFSMIPDGRGSILLRGQLPVLEASPLQKLVTAYVESDRRAHTHDANRLDPLSPSRTPEQRRADALIAITNSLVAGLQAAGHLPLPDPHDTPEHPSRDRQHNPSATSQVNRVPLVAGDRPRVSVMMSYQQLTDQAEQAGLLADGTKITAGELRRLLCDAELVPVVLGSNSEVLDSGRAQRLVTPTIRRALSLRDGGCTFPGCNTPDIGCEAHHITPWWNGGPTALDNLVLLCPHHHGIIEPLRFFSPHSTPRWQVRIAEDGHPEFLAPTRNGTPPKPIRHHRTQQRTQRSGAPPDPTKTLRGG